MTGLPKVVPFALSAVPTKAPRTSTTSIAGVVLGMASTSPGFRMTSAGRVIAVRRSTVNVSRRPSGV